MRGKKKAVLCIVLLLVCTVSFFFGLRNAEEKNVKATAIGTVKVAGYLNVRTGPGTGYSLVKSGGTNVTLSDGAKVTITKKNGDWYLVKFKQNSKTVKGYVLSKYIQVQTGSVCTKVYGNISAKSVNLKQEASSSAASIKTGSKNISLAKGKKVRILSETIVKKQKWYKISVTYNSKKQKGYLLSKDVTLLCEKGLPGVIESASAVTVLKEAGKKTAVTVANQKVTVKEEKQITILSQADVSGVKYLNIKFSYNGTTVKGYIPDEVGFLQIVTEEKAAATPKPTAKPTAKPSAKPTAKPTAKPSAKPTAKPSAKPTAKPSAKPTESPAMTDSEYGEKLKEDGFPESYVSALVDLHNKYPNWTFKPYKTGLKWNDVIKAESKIGLNLISNSKSYAWKSTEEGAYDWKTDKFIPFDGSTWVAVSEQAVKYYMDPRNFLDERGIFQFESLEYQKESHTQEGVEKILQNTPMANKTFTYKSDSGKSKSMKYSKAFMSAASESKVSPYHLASRVKQEVVISATMMSSSVSGKVAGYEGIYNFYNIGAYHSTAAGGAIANGLKWASSGSTYERPWNSPYKSIVGGASYIGKNYINAGQNTLYLQKFNVTSKNRYTHQYMANIEAPNSEATKTNTAYGTDKAEMPMVFSIPVYNSMPEKPCSVPSGGENPNNYLKSLSITGHAFTDKFVLGDDGSKIYKVTVAANVDTIKINAAAVASSATVSGKGTKTVPVGTTTYTVKVTSESGSVRKYKIKVTRKAS